jgi:enterochelin esterase-like enzyme
VSIRCTSPALGGNLPAAVYLPPGYGRSSTRYPVVYFLHGLPAGPGSYTSNAFVAQTLVRIGRRALVVAPQGARSGQSDREYLNWGPTEDWPRAIADDLPACIDRSFRTLADRRGRALIGLSAGGFGAFNIGLRHLRMFAAVESWSGYFEATDPTGLRKLDLGSDEANRKARVPRGHHLIERLVRWPTFIGFYVGEQDDRFLHANIMLDAAFTRHDIPHLFRTYAGGHSGTLWSAQAPYWLGLALDQLERPEG